MAELILFHHAQGLTKGVVAWADQLREAGHEVTVPDLFEGATFPTVEEGVAHAQSIGFMKVVERGVAAAEALSDGLVYAGFSMGTLPAQKLAQTRPGARGALLYHGGIPASQFDTPWPASVPLQLHAMDEDPWVPLDEEIQPLVDDATKAGAAVELFVYPGSAHLFTDTSLADYDEAAAALTLERSLAFLARL